MIIAHLGDADHDGTEDDWRDHHANQLHEAVAKRFHRGAQVRIDLPKHDADNDPDNDLEPEPRVQRLVVSGCLGGHERASSHTWPPQAQGEAADRVRRVYRRKRERSRRRKSPY
jgi:hypothetical protein